MISRGKLEKQVTRKARLSAALRENLKRRKAQARGRAQSHAEDSDLPAEAESAAQAPDFRRNPRSD